MRDPHKVDHGDYSDTEDVGCFGIDERSPPQPKVEEIIEEISEDSSDDQPIVIRKKKPSQPARLRIQKRKREAKNKKEQKKRKNE